MKNVSVSILAYRVLVPFGEDRPGYLPLFIWHRTYSTENEYARKTAEASFYVRRGIRVNK